MAGSDSAPVQEVPCPCPRRKPYPLRPWSLAELGGQLLRLRHLLGRAAWLTEVARDALLAYAAVHLGHADGVAVIDETGFLKKGAHSTGTAGRIENCQVRGFLAYAGPQETVLLDRKFYLPEGWTNELARLWVVGLAPNTPFATKSQLAHGLGDGGYGLRLLGSPAAVAGGAGTILCAGGAGRVNNSHFATDRSLL